MWKDPTYITQGSFTTCFPARNTRSGRNMGMAAKVSEGTASFSAPEKGVSRRDEGLIPWPEARKQWGREAYLRPLCPEQLLDLSFPPADVTFQLD